MRINSFYNKDTYLLVLLTFLYLPCKSYSQEAVGVKPVICYASEKIAKGHIPLYLSNQRLEKLSEFKIVFNDFPAEAQDAFEYAINIWEGVISSPIPINVVASWEDLKEGTLGSSGATSLFRNFHKDGLTDVWYPVSLAERIAGKELNKTNDADINVFINGNVNWYFGTDGNTPDNSIDFVSVILHEIAHGLGFTSSADVEGQSGTLKESGYIMIYDMLLQNDQKERLFSFPSPSNKLYIELTSDKLFVHSNRASDFNNNKFPKVFAPFDFDEGSSISHLDENTFPPGDINSLMSPRFSRGESIHNPGKILLGILDDLGWKGDNPIQLHEEKFVVYPNPNDDGILKIAIPEGVSAIGLKCIDVTGRILLDWKDLQVSSGVEEFDIERLPSGLYYLLISSEIGNQERRLILMK